MEKQLRSFCVALLVACSSGYVDAAVDASTATATDLGFTPDDLAASFYANIGIDPQTEMRDNLNRPLPIAAGRAIEQVFA